MAISNFTLERIYNEYKTKLIGVKISKIVKISDYDFSFILFSKKQESLIISLEPSHPCFLLSSSYFKTLNETNLFVNNLKKYFENGTIINIEKIENDRVIILQIKKVTQTYQTITNKLVIELIPHRANAIIMDMNNVIISALKMSSTLDENHLIIKGLTYQFNKAQDKAITKDDTIDSLKGKIGLTLYKDILYRIEKENDTLENIIEEIINSKDYYVYNNDILSIPLHSLPSKKICLDEISKIYEEKENIKYKKEHYDEIFHLVKHKLKGLRKKLLNLKKDYQKNQDKSSYVEIGNLLFMNQDLYVKGDKEITIEGTKIALDEKLDLVGNAKNYFKQYQKSKVALIELKKQEELTLNKIDFFEKIESQIEFASLEDMKDIIDELKEEGYIKKGKEKHNKNNKPKEKIYSPKIINVSGTKIGFGLSSYQNEYLTFTLSKKDDYFLHIKDYHGPHVIIFSSSPTDEEILFACEICLYFAKKSAGEVYFTQRKNVKKIPSSRGKVSFENYQVININSIREETIKKLKSL